MASSERQANSTRDPWWGEHVHRYLEALQHAMPEHHVLDIACGTGFGSAMLAEKVNEVTGCDISEEAISNCRQAYRKPNLKFLVEDGTKLSFGNECFDLVVSFETIEHTAKYEQMLSEFARILKKNGLLILSTPNFPVNSPSGKVTNPYHTQEFTLNELHELLKKFFSEVVIFGQKYVRYDNCKTWRCRLAQLTEQLLYMRGFRKLPLPLQDSIMKLLSGKPMYPRPEDFALVSGRQVSACKTFYAICSR